MAVIRDVMPAFELFQPTSVDDAFGLIGRYGADAWLLAGGLDSFDWLKDRIKRPRYVVDLSGVSALRGIREVDGGLEIGSMTTLTEVVRHPVVRDRYAILMEAAEAAASPQIRNQGTLGGNVTQDTRCWYYRAGWSCYRAGGNICYADTPQALNMHHRMVAKLMGFITPDTALARFSEADRSVPARYARVVTLCNALNAANNRDIEASIRARQLQTQRVGLLGAVAVTPVMGALLYGVSPRDPLTFGLVTAVLFAAVLVACLVPAWRATRVDPIVALRYE